MTVRIAESESTPQSLLEVLAQDRSSLNWERFLFIYQPLILRWLKQYPAVTEADSHDLLQETLLVVLNRLPEFQHNGRSGAFRAWLKIILHHQVCNHLRHRARTPLVTVIEQTYTIEDPRSDADQLWNAEHDREVLRRLLQLTKPLVPELAWEAFYQTAVVGHESAIVAKQLGMTLNAVYIARSRVMRQLRRLGRGLIEFADSSDNF